MLICYSKVVHVIHERFLFLTNKIVSMSGSINSVLLFLLKNLAHKQPVFLSTTAIADSLGMSQQNISRLLISLEKEGKIERKNQGITITKFGMNEITAFFEELKNAIEGKTIKEEKLIFNGEIVSGVGDGAYYIKKYSPKIKKILGFKPFFGTLNIKLDDEGIKKRQLLIKLEPLVVKEFKDKNRTFGDLFIYSCAVDGIKSAIIIPVRTHHSYDILEIIAPRNLKTTLKKRNGNKIRIVVLHN